MSELRPILVTGATGNVGRGVVATLRERGLPFRAAERHVQKARSVLGEDADIVQLDFLDPSTFAGAVRGCRGVFLLRPPAISKVEATLNPFIDEAARQGVEQVVFLSVAGAEKSKIVPHRGVEDHLMAGQVPWTILRPGFFAQNLSGPYRQDIVEDGRLYVPAGPGRASWVDVRDVGEVAARAFDDPGAMGQAYRLVGPECLDFEAVAAILSQVLGRSISYVPASVPGYLLHLARHGHPMGLVLVQTILHVGLRRGDADYLDPTLEELLGRPPRTLRDFVEDHAEVWGESHPQGQGIS